MKKLSNKVLMQFLIVLIILVISACGNSDTTKDSSTSGTNENDAQATTKEAEIFKLRMNTINPPSFEGTPQTIGESVFIDLVKEKTDGQVEIEIYYSNQLVGQAESLDALAKGTIDIQVIAPSAWSDKIPESSWPSLLFAWETPEQLDNMLSETDVGEIYAEALQEYGVLPLHYYFSAGAGYLSKKPIRSPEDFKGMVVNSPSNLMADFYSEAGASIAAIPFAEYYEGLLRGTIDAILFPYDALESMKLSEVVEYVTTPGQITTAPVMIAMSLQTWEKLPSALQDAIKEAAMESQQLSIEASNKFTNLAIEYAKENGVEIIELTAEDRKKFVEHAQKYQWDKYRAINERTEKIVSTIESYIK